MEKKYTLLVVEDDHDLRAMTRELLADEGYLVVEARNGGEAVALLSGGLRPDLVVMDLCMPIMSGPEVLDWMRAQPTVRPIPVLVVSCKDRTLASLRHEVQGWIAKPPSPSELLTAIARLCAVANRRAVGRRSSGRFRAAV